MPHHPSEETAPDNLTDKVAQHSKDSNASDHAIHDENKGPVSGTTSEALQGSKGPQIVESESSKHHSRCQQLTHATEMPDAKGKEELKAEAKKMNEGN